MNITDIIHHVVDAETTTVTSIEYPKNASCYHVRIHTNNHAKQCLQDIDVIQHGQVHKYINASIEKAGKRLKSELIYFICKDLDSDACDSMRKSIPDKDVEIKALIRSINRPAFIQCIQDNFKNWEETLFDGVDVFTISDTKIYEDPKEFYVIVKKAPMKYPIDDIIDGTEYNARMRDDRGKDM